MVHAPLPTLYGLTFASAFELPGLIHHPPDRADVVVERGQVDVSDAPADDRGRRVRARPGDVRVFWPDVGGFQVVDGRRMVVEPLPGVDERIVVLFVLGAALGLLLHQRGLTVLHAAALDIGGRGAVIVGGKGWGKSTLAAVLVARGHRLLSDDIAALQRGGAAVPKLLPGAPSLKLWPESMLAAGWDPDGAPRLYPEIEKRSVAVEDRFQPAPTPLGMLFCLDEGDAVKAEPMSPTAALVNLLPHWYGARYGVPVIQAVGVPTQLEQCAELVRHARCARVVRPYGLESVVAAACAIETFVAQTPAPAASPD